MATAAELARIAELQAEIAEINTALSHIRKAGQSYTFMTSSGGGSQRVVTMADYEMLKDHRNELQDELNSLQGTSAVRIRAGW